jgi:plastocyanin
VSSPTTDNGAPPQSAVDPETGFAGASDTPVPAEITVAETVALDAPEEAGTEFTFDPVGLYVDSGSTVRFNMRSGSHQIRGYHREYGRTHRLPDGVPPLGSDLLTEGSYWLYTFETRGVYDLYCQPHEYYGMVMRVVVGSGASDQPVQSEADGPNQLQPPTEQAAAVLVDDALGADSIRMSGRVAWDDLSIS